MAIRLRTCPATRGDPLKRTILPISVRRRPRSAAINRVTRRAMVSKNAVRVGVCARAIVIVAAIVMVITAVIDRNWFLVVLAALIAGGAVTNELVRARHR